jgi:hypothetical protein
MKTGQFNSNSKYAGEISELGNTFIIKTDAKDKGRLFTAISQALSEVVSVDHVIDSGKHITFSDRQAGLDLEVYCFEKGDSIEVHLRRRWYYP